MEEIIRYEGKRRFSRRSKYHDPCKGRGLDDVIVGEYFDSGGIHGQYPWYVLDG